MSVQSNWEITLVWALVYYGLRLAEYSSLYVMGLVLVLGTVRSKLDKLGSTKLILLSQFCCECIALHCILQMP